LRNAIGLSVRKLWKSLPEWRLWSRRCQ